jgi:hypothetical protein
MSMANFFEVAKETLPLRVGDRVDRAVGGGGGAIGREDKGIG